MESDNKPLERLFIVGIPRSGSTLTAALVDSLENTLCMSEPSELFIGADASSRSHYIQRAVSSLERYRESVLSGEKLLDRRNSDGTPTTNYVKRSWFSRTRKFRPARGYVDNRRFDANMTVAVKHNVPFLSVLPELVDTGIPVLGIVREPVATILSWHETNLPVAKGWMPSAEAFWPELNRLMRDDESRADGWAKIYDAFCQRLIETGIPIIKYESLSRGVAELEAFVGRKSERHLEIMKKGKADYKNAELAEEISIALRTHGRYAKRIYENI